MLTREELHEITIRNMQNSITNLEEQNKELVEREKASSHSRIHETMYYQETIDKLVEALEDCKKEKEQFEKELCAHDKDCAEWMGRNFENLSQDSNFSIINMHDAFNAGKQQALNALLPAEGKEECGCNDCYAKTFHEED